MPTTVYSDTLPHTFDGDDGPDVFDGLTWTFTATTAKASFYQGDTFQKFLVEWCDADTFNPETDNFHQTYLWLRAHGGDENPAKIVSIRAFGFAPGATWFFRVMATDDTEFWYEPEGPIPNP